MVQVVLPVATGVTISTSSTKITLASDGAAANPFYVLTSSAITVKVLFADGSSIDYTNDKRTVYSVRSSSAALIQLTSTNQISVKSMAVLPTTATSVYVDVSFPGVYSVSGTAVVMVVKLSSVAISAQPYPTVSGWSGNMLTLRKVSCTGLWERLQASASGTLSDGTTQSSSAFYNLVTFTSSDATVAAVSALCSGSLCRGLVPAKAGTVTITGSFYGVQASLQVVVSASSTAVTALSIASNIGSSSTLSGVAGTVATMSVTALFDDGTNMAVSYSGATSSSWLTPSALLSFASARPTALAVSSQGIVTLSGNYYMSTALTASDKCGSGVSNTLNEFSNLSPAVYDVDLGATVGAPFGVAVVGSTFTVPVRIQASTTRALTAFQVG